MTTEISNLQDAKDAFAKALHTDVAAYIRRLDTQSPIVSDSHHWLHGLYRAYGKTAADNEIDRQFEERRT